MRRAQVISQQNTRTENQNVVRMCHIKKYFKNSKKNENRENIQYFRKISHIYPIYINDIYRRYISSQPCSTHKYKWMGLPETTTTVHSIPNTTVYHLCNVSSLEIVLEWARTSLRSGLGKLLVPEVDHGKHFC